MVTGRRWPLPVRRMVDGRIDNLRRLFWRSAESRTVGDSERVSGAHWLGAVDGAEPAVRADPQCVLGRRERRADVAVLLEVRIGPLLVIDADDLPGGVAGAAV